MSKHRLVIRKFPKSKLSLIFTYSNENWIILVSLIKIKREIVSNGEWKQKGYYIKIQLKNYLLLWKV
uniref:Putative orf66 protein n=1 Tax=Chondrus crispus TaxID=2769 RepID=Q36330_CHOCR|nr:putative orf66 [Chondrus crispus]